jgi:ABC-type multidrug transport system fused ATPase/permease subunit
MLRKRACVPWWFHEVHLTTTNLEVDRWTPWNKRAIETQKMTLGQLITLISAMLLSLIFLIMAYYIPENNLAFEILSYLILTISFLLVFCTSLINSLNDASQIVEFHEEIQNNLEPYFEELNAKEYEKRGLEWYLIPGYYWLELRICTTARRRLK